MSTGRDEHPARGARVRVLPPVLFAVPFALGWLVHLGWAWSMPGRPLVQWVGALVLAAALGLMAWALLTLRRQRTTFVPWDPVDRLVTTGPFARSRNPIYLADALAHLGGSMALASWWPLLTLPLALLALWWWVIDREETYLLARFGAEYRAYADRVRRLI